VRGARQDREAGRPPKNFRALFRALTETVAGKPEPGGDS